MRTLYQPFLLVLLPIPSAAMAEDFSVTGSASFLTDYRFRGVSQSDRDPAIQGSIAVNHKSGLYAGTFGSSLAGWGTFGGPNLETDLFGGYRFPVGPTVSVDVGLTWYMYAGGADATDFAEAYAKLTGTWGAASLTVGMAYAPRQEALGRVYRTGAELAAGTPSHSGSKGDNLYLWGDAALPIASTPLTLKGHLEYSDGNPGLGPNGTSVAPTGRYLDWSLGVDASWKNLTLGVAYVDADIGRADRLPLLPGFGTAATGASISDPTVVVSLTASF